MARALARDSDVEVLTARTTGHYEPPPGMRIRRAPVLRDRSGYLRGYLPYLSFDVPLLVRLVLARRADAVIVEPPPTTGAVVRLVCSLTRRPYIWYAADVWSDAAASTGSPDTVVRLLRALESWVLRGAAASVAVSDGVANRVRELGGESVVVVGNGVDTDVFSLDGPRRGDGRTLVYAGTASEWQGADVFVRAMRQVVETISDARLVFIGQGSGLAEIKKLAAELPSVSVSILGNVPAAESAAWLRGAAGALVSIIPGQGYDFAIPTKVYASLATGTPVLYAGVGPVVEILDKDALGVAVGYDADAVADAMIALLRAASVDDHAHRQRRAEWVADNRSLTAVADRVVDVLRDVIGG